MPAFVDNLKKLIKERGITQKKFLADMDLNINAIGDWTKYGNIPKGDTLQRIANYFSVSVDFLLGKSDIAVDDSVLDIVDGIDQDILETAGSDLNIALKWQTDRDHLEAQLEAAHTVNRLSADEHDLVDMYRQLPDFRKTKVLFYAKQELFAKWHEESQKEKSAD